MVGSWMPWLLLILTTVIDIEGRTKSHKSMPHYSRWFRQQLGEHPGTMESPLSLGLFPDSLCTLTVWVSPWDPTTTAQITLQFLLQRRLKQFSIIQNNEMPISIMSWEATFSLLPKNLIKNGCSNNNNKKSDFWHKCGNCQILFNKKKIKHSAQQSLYLNI